MLMLLQIGSSAVTGSAVNELSFQSKIDSDLLVLDVGTMRFRPGRPPGPATASAEECAGFCRITTGCNAWSYCHNPYGCGTGCLSYVASHPALNTTDPDTFWIALPVTSFGPFVYYSPTGCQTPANASDQRAPPLPSDRWPYGLCSLLHTSTPKAPAAAQTVLAEGWVSGTLIMPPSCDGLSAVACQACLNSKDLVGCSKCANATATDASSAVIRGNPYFHTQQHGCAVCYNSTAPQGCVACLTSDTAPCKQCVEQVGGASSTFDVNPPQSSDVAAAVSSCITCVAHVGASFVSQCVACGLSKDPNRCTDCLGAVADNYCHMSSNSSVDPFAGCIPASSNVCKVCTDGADAGSSAADRCVQCATNQPYSLDCESCLLQPDAGRVRRCYDCVAAANTSAAGCSDCLDDNLDAAVVQECIACLANNETAGKRWCVGCSNWYKDDAFHRERCYACLKEDKNDTMDYMHACSKVQWQDVLLPYRRLP
eukprot:jgi/Chrzof1/1474/Cz10g09070.t1